MKSLCFRPTAAVIVDNPDRPNIKINVQNIKSNAAIDKTFDWLMSGLRKNSSNFPKHLIFCNSIKDCSSIYTTFVKHFGNSNFFDMYHSKTTEATKEKIRLDMGQTEGKIRILICTNAAGMGVNFKDINNVIHYGPPKELDTFIQQMGRAGRDNTFSQELLIYKSSHLSRVDDDIIKLIKTKETCRRQIISNAYMNKLHCVNLPKHLCCDICELACKCSENLCPLMHAMKQKEPLNEEVASRMEREVSDEERTLVKHKLDNLHEASNHESLFVQYEVTHGFSLDEILSQLQYLFTVDDIFDLTTITSHQLALQIVRILNEIFGENEMYDCVEDMEMADDDNEFDD